MGGGGIGVPAAGGFAGDGSDVFDGDLAPAGAGAFDLEVAGFAGLLVYFLVGGGLIAKVEERGGIGFEEEDAAFFGEGFVVFVEDGAAEGEAFEVGGVAGGVGHGEDAVALGEAAVDEVGADEKLLGQFDHLVMAVAEDQEEFVELGAIEFEFVAVDFVADVAGFAVVGGFEGFEGDFAGFDFLVAAAAGEAGVEGAVVVEEGLEVSDRVADEVLEVLAGGGEVGFDSFEFLAVLADVEEGDAADADLEETVDVLG